MSNVRSFGECSTPILAENLKLAANCRTAHTRVSYTAIMAKLLLQK
jgi:hypothetical protein